MFRSILPKEYAFFDLFEEHSSLCIDLSKIIMSMTDINASEIPKVVEEVNRLEAQMDDLTKACIEAIHKTFITPIERGDIHSLISKLDDVADYMQGAAMRIEYYEITVIRSEVKDLGQIIFQAATKINEALTLIRSMKNIDKIRECCVEIHRLEGEGDIVLRHAILRLFKENDAILVIKWKEIFERLEKAIDRCEAVANIIEEVLIESA